MRLLRLPPPQRVGDCSRCSSAPPAPPLLPRPSWGPLLRTHRPVPRLVRTSRPACSQRPRASPEPRLPSHPAGSRSTRRGAGRLRRARARRERRPAGWGRSREPRRPSPAASSSQLSAAKGVAAITLDRPVHLTGDIALEHAAVAVCGRRQRGTWAATMSRPAADSAHDRGRRLRHPGRSLGLRLRDQASSAQVNDGQHRHAELSRRRLRPRHVRRRTRRRQRAGSTRARRRAPRSSRSTSSTTRAWGSRAT